MTALSKLRWPHDNHAAEEYGGYVKITSVRAEIVMSNNHALTSIMSRDWIPMISALYQAPSSKVAQQTWSWITKMWTLRTFSISKARWCQRTWIKFVFQQYSISSHFQCLSWSFVFGIIILYVNRVLEWNDVYSRYFFVDLSLASSYVNLVW